MHGGALTTGLRNEAVNVADWFWLQGDSSCKSDHQLPSSFNLIIKKQPHLCPSCHHPAAYLIILSFRWSLIVLCTLHLSTSTHLPVSSTSITIGYLWPPPSAVSSTLSPIFQIVKVAPCASVLAVISLMMIFFHKTKSTFSFFNLFNLIFQ